MYEKIPKTKGRIKIRRKRDRNVWRVVGVSR